MNKNCNLILSDGNQFRGEHIGAAVAASGEMVFTTGMVGYSEAITDPSYYGQILVFAYPLIGNYGINAGAAWGDILPQGFESVGPQVAGVIFAVNSVEAFHWNSAKSIDSWLKDEGIPGIIGVDTRHLVHLIRSTPNLLGRMLPENAQGYRYAHDEGLDDRFFDPGAQDIIDRVSTAERAIIGSGRIRIGVIDCGVKWNIIRQLNELGCEVELLPWNTDLKTVDCSGWLISNGPGDPQRTGELCSHITGLLAESRPILGICLGHQILALAAGATTHRMPFGHRSHNQPVFCVGTRTGYMTTQNHGYVVEGDSLPDGWGPWFRNINDQSIEGIRHDTKPLFSVQFHPEAAGGPRDTSWILKQFVNEVQGNTQ
ncbi:MAG: glutamine-hydrolyzing carbamoyl-phosphate synthase small subunit [Pseudomonadales bacterium]